MKVRRLLPFLALILMPQLAPAEAVDDVVLERGMEEVEGCHLFLVVGSWSFVSCQLSLTKNQEPMTNDK